MSTARPKRRQVQQSTESYWAHTSRLPRFAKLASDLNVDVVVVGGGITGVTAAYLLKNAGKRVALLERDRFAKAETGHTSAHLSYVTDSRLHELVKRFGKDRAQAVWDSGQAALNQIVDLIERESIDCEFSWVPGFLHSAIKDNGDELKGLEEDLKLAREFGFNAEFVGAVPFVGRPGIRFSNQALFHPAKYLRGLLDSLPGNGSHVFEHTEANEFEQNPMHLRANGHTIQCDYVVIATHVPLMGQTGLLSATLFQSKLTSYTTYVVGARLKKGQAAPSLFWDTGSPYHYLRIARYPRHDYVIFGGEDHKTGQNDKPDLCYERLQLKLAAIFPEARVNRRWCGQVVETNDGLPLIGETAERQFVATGFAGNGLTFGTLSAMMAKDKILGRHNPWQDLYDVGRKNIVAGAWDYLKENVDYPFYYVKDRLTAAENEPVEKVIPGDGKILKLHGKRIAVYRDHRGAVTTLSPYCTHMGCLVRWNRADETWDCPCHRSRFQPTGAVLAGPAETPLEKAEE